MTTTTAQDFIENTLDDYLVSLAEGIQEAQIQLNRIQIAGPGGQSPITYHLPRVDFELKLTFEMTQGPQTSSTGTTKIGTSSVKGPVLVFKPAIAQQSGGQQVQAEALSIIKGSFVAVPANGGQPPPVLRCSLARGAAPGETLVTVTLLNAIGEPQSGVEVQFNIDPERSAALSAPDVPQLKLQADTRVLYGVRVTDSNGQAQNTLRVSPNEPAKAIVALVIDAMGQTETVIAQGGTK